MQKLYGKDWDGAKEIQRIITLTIAVTLIRVDIPAYEQYSVQLGVMQLPVWHVQ